MRQLISFVTGRASQAMTAVQRAVSPMRRGPVLWLALCGSLLVVAIFVGTVLMVGEFRNRAIANSERELQNTVTLLQRHFDEQFDDYHVLTRNLIAQLDLSAVASPDVFRQRMSGLAEHLKLKSEVTVLSYIDGVNIYDADGRLINSSGVWPLPGIDISKRRYFRIFKSAVHPPDFLAEALRSYYTGQWTIILAHRLSGANGVFLGVLTRRIDPFSYEQYFASVALGDGSAIAMLHRDGTMLVRYPRVDGSIGKKFNRAPLLQAVLRRGGSQTLRVRSPVDAMERLGSATALKHIPIVIVATRTVAAALADWQAQTRFLIFVAALSALVIAVLLFFIIREINRESQDAQCRLEAERHALDTALNNMTQGLLLYDASGRVVTFNRRYIDMFNLSTEVVKRGCHFRDLLQHRKDTGTYDGDVRAYCDPVMRNVAAGKASMTIMENGDGRSFQIINKPLAQGGWVATIEDITERRTLEIERDRNYTFLREIIDHLPAQVTVKDAKTRQYLLVNSVAEFQFGKPREEIVGKTAFDMFRPELAAIVTADDDKTLQAPGDLFLDEHPWDSQPMGLRYITSKRIGIRDSAGEARYIVNVVEDVTERREAAEKIAHLAHYDALTDLPNRVLFREQIERELQRARQGRQFALLYIDIDEFKGINDSLGHHVGDKLLQTVATRIRACIRSGDLIARLGGDEFAVIRTGVASIDDVVDFVTRLHETIRRPYECLGHQLSTDASIGIALAPRDGTELDQLIKNADLAMYAAKADGRRTHRFFEPAMGLSAKARLSLEQDLRQAMTDGGFEIHYQPVVDLRLGEVRGCEALLRWRHPQRGMVPPAEFIPVTEDTGLITELGEWVLRTACAEASTWPDHVRLAVNVSPVQLKCQTLALRIAGALAASGLKPDRLEIEITEAVLIRDDEAALAILHQLRSIGVRIALDDFGTGFSSLSYLKRFPFDKIKIDRCFVSDISEADGSLPIVQAVVNLATALNMTTTAEGVETEQQREVLQRLGCTEMQGYLFSAPKPAAEVRPVLGEAGRETAAVA